MFIKSRIYLDDEYVVMTRNYFLQYTQLEIPEFRDTLIQHMESVKKSIDKKALHKIEYDNWVNERQMQTTEEKVDTSKALDASLVNIESSGTESGKQDTSSSSGIDVDADDADIKPVYDEEPMAEVQLTAEINVLATGQQHTEQPEFNNEGEVDQNAEQWHNTCPLPAILTDNQKPEHSYQSLESENICLKKTVAQIQKDFLRMEAHCVNLELKYQNQTLKEGQHGPNFFGSKKWFLLEKNSTSSTTKVDNEPTNGSNDDITNQYECEQTLDVSAGTLNLSAAMTSDHNSSELRIHDHNNEPSSLKLVSKVVPPTDKTTTSRQELELLFHHHITMPSESDLGSYTKYNKVKAKLALLNSSASAPSSSSGKNKGLIAETYDLDEEEVSSDDNEVTKVKALMALADEERVSVGKESTRNGEWIKISMKKVHTLLEMEDNDDRKSFLDYMCIDLNYVEEQRNNLMSKHKNLVQELNTCKEQLLVLKQPKLDLLTMQHCISEQIPTQKKKILGIDQLTKDTSSSGPKYPVLVKSSADNSKVSITGSNKPKLSEAEVSTLSNHDTGKVPSNESQRNTTDHSVVVSDSSTTDHDSADESSVCSTPSSTKEADWC
ncbi:hypothetical protein Tco_1482615 [Tanacetum coccineum]